MSELHEVATVAEPTVQAVARGEVEPPKRERRRRGRGKPKSSKVRSNATIYDQMIPEVADVVRRMDPDLRHIQVVNPQVVVVWKHPAPWPEQPGALA
jgi:hypothetical protein